LGWESLESGRSLNIVPGAGFVDVPFTLHEGTLDPGLVKLRAIVSLEGGQDLNPDNNQLEFTLLVDEAQLQGARSLDLPGGHEVLGFFGLRGENLMFTGAGSSLWVHRINSQYDLITCLELENDWAGEFTIDNGESDSAYVSWTRRYTDQFGVTLSTLTFSSVDLSCTSTAKMDLLPSLMLAEGTYWGIDLAVNGGEVLIGGYHRDLFTSGTYDDETSIFLLAAESPLDRESWNLTENIVTDLEPPINREGSVKVAHGNNWTHITYQANRDDETGVERVGTFYAHGRLGVGNWSFKVAVGDQTTINELAVLPDSEGADVVVMAWREGIGQDAKLVVIRADSSMQTQDVVNLSAPGMGMIQFVKTKRGIQMFHDSVGPSGRQIVYSIIEANQTIIGTPIGEGELMSAGRSDIAGETHLFYLSPTQDWRARMLIDDSALDLSNNGILDRIRIWTGLDASTFTLAVRIVGVALAVGCLLVFLASAGIITHRRRRGPKLTVEIEDDEEVIDVDEDYVSIIEEDEYELDHIDSSEKSDKEDIEEEIVSESIEQASKTDLIGNEDGEEDGTTRRQKRRQERRKAAEPKSEELPPPPSPSELEGELPPPPTPMELGTLPPPPGIDVTCECGANFRVKSIELKYVQCPVCSERINL